MTENTDIEFVSMVMPSSAAGTATTGISEMEANTVRDFLRSGKPCRDIETSVAMDATCLVDFLQQVSTQLCLNEISVLMING